MSPAHGPQPLGASPGVTPPLPWILLVPSLPPPDTHSPHVACRGTHRFVFTRARGHRNTGMFVHMASLGSQWHTCTHPRAHTQTHIDPQTVVHTQRVHTLPMHLFSHACECTCSYHIGTCAWMCLCADLRARAWSEAHTSSPTAAWWAGAQDAGSLLASPSAGRLRDGPGGQWAGSSSLGRGQQSRDGACGRASGDSCNWPRPTG